MLAHAIYVVRFKLGPSTPRRFGYDRSPGGVRIRVCWGRIPGCICITYIPGFGKRNLGSISHHILLHVVAQSFFFSWLLLGLYVGIADCVRRLKIPTIDYNAKVLMSDSLLHLPFGNSCWESVYVITSPTLTFPVPKICSWYPISQHDLITDTVVAAVSSTVGTALEGC
jgi:hypothetical protein